MLAHLPMHWRNGPDRTDWSEKTIVLPEIQSYNDELSPNAKKICDVLATEIERGLPGAENKIWHGHPVWFLAGNPIVGYSQQKRGLRLMFCERRGL